MIRQFGLGAILACICHSTSWGVMTHQYTFNDGTFNDVIGGAAFDGTPYNGATAAGGQLQLEPMTFQPAGRPVPFLADDHSANDRQRDDRTMVHVHRLGILYGSLDLYGPQQR